MLKTRIIPILTFNGIGLVKTKQFSNPRMVGNPVQAARVYNQRGVDELVFIDIYASEQNRKINLKLVSDVIKECYMPVAIGGGISTIDDITNLLKIGADKVVIKTKALTDPDFIKRAVSIFGSQCITISVDAIAHHNDYKIYNRQGIDLSLNEFTNSMMACEVGEFIINSLDYDGMMNGYNFDLINTVLKNTNLPVIAVGGGGEMTHYKQLMTETKIEAVGSSSIFHFTQFTPRDIKNELNQINVPVRL